MTFIDHVRRVADQAKRATDDLDGIHHPADDADTPYVQAGLAGRRPARDILPAAMLLEALGPAGLRRLQAPGGIGVVVHVPGPDWAPHVELALRGLASFAYIFTRVGLSRSQDKATEGNDRVGDLLSQGAMVAGISHRPERFLPSTLVAGADLVVRIGAPSNRMISRMIREVTGRRARHIPPGIARSLGFDALASCLRLESSPTECVARLQAAARAASGIDLLLDDVPDLDDLKGYGPGLDWARRLVKDLDTWRDGNLEWRDIKRFCLLSGEPGTGKSTLVRAIAKAARLPLISTGVTAWMTPSGYLNDVLKAAEEAFARAAAQAPAILFLDEIDSIPNRITMDNRGRDYWTPLVNCVLTNLDSNTSGDNSKLIIIGASNHAEGLDPALTRPGRLHPTIRIGRPSVEDLAGIVRQHLGADLPGASLEGVALLGVGATGADAAAWVKEARSTARAEGRRMALSDLVAAVAPPDQRTEEEIRICALHEASHAVICLELDVGTVTSVTIAMGRNSAGRAVSRLLPRAFLTRPQIERIAIVALAGRAMDALTGAPHTGAGGERGSDLDRATEAVLALHAAYGLGDSLTFIGGPAEAAQAMRVDPRLRRKVDADLMRLYGQASVLVRQHRPAIEAVAERLVADRVLSGAEVTAIVEAHRATKGRRGGGVDA